MALSAASAPIPERVRAGRVGQRAPAWRWALLAAVLGHGLLWALWHQRGGQASSQHGEGVPLQVRFQSLRPVTAGPPSAAMNVARASADTPQPVAPQARPSQTELSVLDRLPPAAGPGAQVTPRPAEGQEAAAAGSPLDARWLDPQAYLSADSVDVPPQLLGAWRINEHAVPRGAQGAREVHVTVRLWVGADGRIDAYQVLGVEPEVPWVESLLEPLGLSTLLPAHQAGRAVASDWTIELTLDLSGGL